VTAGHGFENWRRFHHPHGLDRCRLPITTRPPGRVTRTSSAITAVGSAANSHTVTATATSKRASSHGSWWTSPSTNSTGHTRAGDGERRRIGVDAHDARTFGFEPGHEAAGAATGVAHLQPGDGPDGIEEQIVFDAARVATPRLVEPCVVGGSIGTPA